jgi:hypothetical protein
MTTTDEPANPDLLDDVRGDDPRDAKRVNMRLTQLERAKIDRARGDIPISDWCRQECVRKAELIIAGRTDEAPTAPRPDGAALRRLDQLMIRLGLRMKRQEELISDHVMLMLFEISYQLRPASEVPAARDYAALELQRFKQHLESNARLTDDPVDVQTEIKTLKAGLADMVRWVPRPGSKKPWFRRGSAGKSRR